MRSDGSHYAGAGVAVAAWVARMFDPRGRCDRKGLALIALILLPTQLAFAVIVFGLDLAWDHPIAVIGNAALLWIGFAAVANRLHDLGRGAIWFLYATALYLAWSFVIATFAILAFGADSVVSAGAGFYFVFAANCAPMLAAVLYVHFKAGEGCANRFGPVPGPDGFSYRTAGAGEQSRAVQRPATT